MSEVIISPGVFQIESDQSLYTTAPQVVGAAIVGPTVFGIPFVPTYITTYNQYLTLFGDVFRSGSYYYEYFTSMAAREYFQNGGRTLLVTRIVSGSDDLTTYAQSTVPSIAPALTSSFVLETLAWGDIMNSSSSFLGVDGDLDSGSAYNVRWEVTNVNTSSTAAGGTFGIIVRRGDDNNKNKNVLETWSNLSLDPQLPNYISRVIGDLKPSPDVATGVVTYTGNYANASRYIRVKSVTTPHVNSKDNNGRFKGTQYSGSLPALGSGSFAGGVADTNLVKNMNENITINNIQGFSPNDYENGFKFLTDKEGFQFNLLLAPGVGLDTSAASNMITTVESRGDALAILDAGIYNTAITNAVQNASGQQSSYGATYYPWVQLFSNNLGKTVWCPPSTVIGGVMAFNDQVTAEWFAPAGLNRGGLPSVVAAERRLQQTDRDVLYEGNVNPIATFPGAGICVWGQKTLQQKQTALDRVNVRRLLINLKGYIGNIARTLVFEQNTTATRNRFLAQVNPYLSSVVQRQGLYAFKVVMDDSNNTPDVIDRNQLVGQIYIQPTKTAEFVILNFNILPTGATFPA
jgi:phage tail sheath protein FI